LRGSPQVCHPQHPWAAPTDLPSFQQEHSRSSEAFLKFAASPFHGSATSATLDMSIIAHSKGQPILTRGSSSYRSTPAFHSTNFHCPSLQLSPFQSPRFPMLRSNCHGSYRSISSGTGFSSTGTTLLPLAQWDRYEHKSKDIAGHKPVESHCRALLSHFTALALHHSLI
jgi:hypothetical protein